MGITLLLTVQKVRTRLYIYTMLIEKSLSSNNFIKHLTVLIVIGVFFNYLKKKHLIGKLWDVHWQIKVTEQKKKKTAISHWTKKRKQKVVNKSKSWIEIPTQFRETHVFRETRGLVFGIWLKSSNQKSSLKLKGQLHSFQRRNDTRHSI